MFDGANIWVSDFGSAKVFKLDSAGAILQTVTLGGTGTPGAPALQRRNPLLGGIGLHRQLTRF